MAENLVIEPRPTVGAEGEETQLRIADILPMVQHTIRQEEAPVWRSPRRPRQLEDDPVWDFTATPTSGDALKYRPIELGGEDLMGLLAGGGAAGWGAAKTFQSNAERDGDGTLGGAPVPGHHVGKDGELVREVRVETPQRRYLPAGRQNLMSCGRGWTRGVACVGTCATEQGLHDEVQMW